MVITTEKVASSVKIGREKVESSIEFGVSRKYYKVMVRNVEKISYEDDESLRRRVFFVDQWTRS